MLPPTLHTLELAQEVSSEFSVSDKHVRILETYATVSAEMTGILHPKICLPIMPYSDDSMKHIIAHEFMHYRYKDLWFRWIAVFGAVLFWFNPLIRRMLHYVCTWDEIHCDACVCRVYPRRAYALTLCQISEAAVEMKELSNIHDSSWVKGSFLEPKQLSEQEERIEYIMKITKQKSVGVVLAMGVMLVSVGTTALAADSIATEAFASAKNVLVVPSTAVLDTSDDSIEEYSEQLTDEMLAEWGIVLNPEISTYAASNGSIDIDLKQNVWNSGAFLAGTGNTISVSVSSSPNTVNIKVGIVDPSGVYRYVTGSGGVGHNFSLTQSGFYRVVIYNETTTQVHIFGAYVTY